jgi:hypothetical protein
MNENDIRNRINTLFAEYHTNANQLCNGDTAFQSRLFRQLNKGAAITSDTLIRVLDAFPEISSDWLISGRGEMKAADNLPHISGEEADRELDLHAKLAQLAAEVDELKKDKFILEDRVKWLKDYNQELITKIARGEGDARKSIS